MATIEDYEKIIRKKVGKAKAYFEGMYEAYKIEKDHLVQGDFD